MQNAKRMQKGYVCVPQGSMSASILNFVVLYCAVLNVM